MSKQIVNKEKAKNYNSFTDLAMAWGCRPYSKKLKNPQKLKSLRLKFFEHHMCKGCGKPMVWGEGTNIAYCNNPDCKGIPEKRKDGTIIYYPSFEILDNKSSSIAEAVDGSYIEEQEQKTILNKKEKKDYGNEKRND